MPSFRRIVLPVIAALAATLLPAAAQAQSIKPLSVVKAPGGALATGEYSCHQQYGSAGYTYKLVELVSATTYAWRAGKRTTGAMKYDAASGAIAFASGPLGKTFHAMFGRRDDGHPIFILMDRDLEPKADAYDYCVLRTGK
jgi:hypothetical protein